MTFTYGGQTTVQSINKDESSVLVQRHIMDIKITGGKSGPWNKETVITVICLEQKQDVVAVTQSFQLIV